MCGKFRFVGQLLKFDCTEKMKLQRSTGVDMDIHIREIESKDYTSAAAIWRDVLGFSSVTDKNVIETYENKRTCIRYSADGCARVLRTFRLSKIIILVPQGDMKNQ